MYYRNQKGCAERIEDESGPGKKIRRTPSHPALKSGEEVEQKMRERQRD